MKYHIFSVLMLLALLLVNLPTLAAQNNVPEGFPLTIVDASGQELTFDEPPHRVICYYTGCIEALVALGMRPIAVPEWFDQFPNLTLQNTPDGMADVEIIPVNDGVPSPEVVAALQPDLVMTDADGVAALAGIAPAFDTYRLNSLDDVISNLRRYAELLNRETEAETMIAAFEARLGAYARLTPDDLTVMSIGVDMGDPTYRDFLFVRSTNSPDCEILNLVAQCPWELPPSSDSWWSSFPANFEYLMEKDPDVILTSSIYYPDPDEVRQTIYSDPVWSQLSAVENARYILAPDDLSADGIVAATRFVDIVIPAIYPDIFPDGPLTDEQVQEILAEANEETCD